VPDDAIKLEIKGLEEAQRKATQLVKDMFGEPMLNAMRDATLYVLRDAKKLAPVDTGRLRASITPEVRSENEAIMGVIGSNVEYAPYQEFGTGQFNDSGSGLSPGIYKMPQLMVKLGIRKGGIRPKRYLRGAVEQNATKIYRRIEIAVRQIINK